jgi:GxxExxY protein
MFKDITGHERLTEQVIASAIAVHSFFGAGLLESVYKACLTIELMTSNLKVNLQCSIPLVYKGRVVGAPFRPDLIVADTVLVEVKAVAALAPVHTAQVITYLKLTGCPVGLLMNFNTPLLRDGIRQIVHPDLFRKREG